MSFENLIQRDWAIFDDPKTATFQFRRGKQTVTSEGIKGLLKMSLARTARAFSSVSLNGSEAGFTVPTANIPEDFEVEVGDKFQISGQNFWYSIISLDEQTFDTKLAMLCRREE